MSQVVSPVNGRPYGLAAVCRVWRIGRSGVYLLARPRGPKHHRGGAGQPARCPMTRSRWRSAPYSPPAGSMVKAIARSGRDCVTPAPERRGGAFSD